MKISQRARNLVPSATLAIGAKARQMQADGIDVIGFAQGEPDFDTPGHIKEAAIQAARDGFTKYTATGGINELKDAVAAKLKRDNGLTYARNQVLVSCGGKHSLYNVFQALLDPGDEVIIPAPYWVSFPEQVKLCDATPVIVQTKESQGFRLNREILEPAVTPRTKIVVLNSPSNPTGAALSRTELEGVAALAVQRGLCIVSDETNEALVYDGFQHVSIASLSAAAYAHTIVVNSLSKAYAMTGWRLGYAAGPAEIIKAMDGLQGQMTSNPDLVRAARCGGRPDRSRRSRPTRCARSSPSGDGTSWTDSTTCPGFAAIARKGPSTSFRISPDSMKNGIKGNPSPTPPSSRRSCWMPPGSPWCRVWSSETTITSGSRLRPRWRTSRRAWIGWPRPLRPSASGVPDGMGDPDESAPAACGAGGVVT